MKTGARLLGPDPIVGDDEIDRADPRGSATFTVANVVKPPGARNPGRNLSKSLVPS